MAQTSSYFTAPDKSKVVLLQMRAVCRASSSILNKSIVVSWVTEQYSSQRLYRVKLDWYF